MSAKKFPALKPSARLVQSALPLLAGALVGSVSDVAHAGFTPKSYIVMHGSLNNPPSSTGKIFYDVRSACNFEQQHLVRADAENARTSGTRQVSRQLIRAEIAGRDNGAITNVGTTVCVYRVTDPNTQPAQVSEDIRRDSGVIEAPCPGEVLDGRPNFNLGYRPGGSATPNFESGKKTCECNSGTTQVGNSCVPPEESSTYKVDEKNTADRGGVCAVGNPINPATGAKYLTELDYQGGGGPIGLRFERNYNSRIDNGAQLAGLGYGWRHSYSRSIIVDSAAERLRLRVVRPNGGTVEFREQTDGTFQADADVTDRLVALRDANNVITGYRFTEGETETSETFSAAGLLQTISNRAGWAQSITWSTDATSFDIAPGAGFLLAVTDQNGRQLQLRYNEAGFIKRMVDPAGRNYDYEYDAASNLTSVTNPRGETRRYHYNEATHIATSETSDPDGLPHALTGITGADSVRFADYRYQADGRATDTSHALGDQRHALVFNEDGSTTVTDPLNTQRTYRFAVTQGVAQQQDQSVPCNTGSPYKSASYDDNGNLAHTVDFNDNRTNYVFDTARNLETSRTEGLTADGNTTPESRTTSTRWHPTFRLPERVARPLLLTTYEYDAAGNLRFMRQSATLDTTGTSGLEPALNPQESTRVWEWTYNAQGQVRTINGPRTDVDDITTYEYYTTPDTTTPPRWRVGDLRYVRNALSQTTEFREYDQHGAPKHVVDSNNLETRIEYDELGRIRERQVGSLTTRFTYNNRGLLEIVTSPDNSSLTYSYDAAHRLERVQDNLGNRITYTVIDGMGNRRTEEVRDPDGLLRKTQQREYDELNRLHREIGGSNPATQITAYEYDGGGNLRTVTDARSRVTTRTYDALNRLRDVIQPVLEAGQPGPTTTYRYNGQDQLAGVDDPRRLSTTYVVNGFGERRETASPDTGRTVNTYDLAGNLKTTTDAKNQTTSYDYDALNRVTDVRLHDGSTQQYVYDTGANGVGRLASITERNAAGQTQAVVAYGYDTQGRVSTLGRTVGTRTFSVGYGYDASGRLETLTYPSGRSIRYTFNALGQPSGITTTASGGTAQTVVSDVRYQAFGGVKQFQFGNGQTFTRNYDLDGRVDQYTLGGRTFSVGYDRTGQLDSIRDTADISQTTLYTYDNLGRIESATLPNTTYSYRHDGVGNRTRAVSGGTVNYTYPTTSNRLTSVGAAAQTFDDNGSLTGNAAGTFAYDVRGRMNQATTAAGGTNYLIAADGLRLRKTNSLEDTIYVYDLGNRLVAESTPTGTVTKEYIYLGDILVAVVAP